MKINPIFYFPIFILALNILTLLFAVVTNSGVIAGFFGGLAALLMDPMLIACAIIAGLVGDNAKKSISFIFVISIIVVISFHIYLNTKYLFVDIVRFDAVMIIASLTLIFRALLLLKNPTSK